MGGRKSVRRHNVKQDKVQSCPALFERTIGVGDSYERNILGKG